MNFYKLKGNLKPQMDAETTHRANIISVNEHKVQNICWIRQRSDSSALICHQFSIFNC